MKKLLKDYLVLFAMVITVILLDQYTKQLVRESIPFGNAWAPWPWLLPYMRIVNWYNTGVAFGLLQGMGGSFTIIAIIVSVAILYYFPRVPASDWTLRVAMGLQMGGALGNMIDRLTRGFVTDFISVGNFAVFNIADASITVGVLILLLGVYLQERRKPKEPAQEAFSNGEQEKKDALP